MLTHYVILHVLFIGPTRYNEKQMKRARRNELYFSPSVVAFCSNFLSFFECDWRKNIQPKLHVYRYKVHGQNLEDISSS